MSQNNIDICPISAERINENVARLAAVYVILISLIGLAISSWLVFLGLGLDFALRSFTNGQASPIRQISKWSAARLKLGQKPTDAAPKKFAAGIGFIFSLVIAALIALQFSALALLVAGVLLFCAALEGFFGFCVGCVVYAKLVVPFFKGD